MLFKFVFTIFLGLVIFISSCHGETNKSIPKLLLPCYRDDYIQKMPLPPHTIQVLVELLRKVEFDKGGSLNLRMLTTSLLHSVKFDGVVRSSGVSSENVMPYKATGDHFSKYKLIVDYFTSGDKQLFPDDTLSTLEMCLLHKIISNTLEKYSRGNEGNTCPHTKYLPDKQNYLVLTSPQVSICPIEHGVANSMWGPVSPSHIIAGIASALQETKERFNTLTREITKIHNGTLKVLDEIEQQNSNATTLTPVTIKPEPRNNDTKKTVFRTKSNIEVSNVWVSTVVGDLSEVVLNQFYKTPIIANKPLWNDTLFPRLLYLNEDQWDMSRAEMLGGLDGAIIASKVKEWINIMDRTRLSQIFDMYYSHRGIAYDKKIKACDRKSQLGELFQYINLNEQVSCVADLLRNLKTFPYYTEEGIDIFSETVVNAYMSTAERITSMDSCDLLGYSPVNPMEIIVIVDGTWHHYEAQRAIAYLAEQADVSYYSSSIGVINGQTGNWMTNVTNDIVKFFVDLSSNENDWPTSLVLSTSFSTVAMYYQNKTVLDCNEMVRKPKAKIVVVLAHASRIDDTDFSNIESTMQSIRAVNPEVKIIYATKPDNTDIFERVARVTQEGEVVKTADTKTLIDSVIAKVRQTPSKIINDLCNNGSIKFEDYLTPEIDRTYEIHYSYVSKGDTVVKFKGHDYSEEIKICAYSSDADENKVCKGITVENDEVSFNAREHCRKETACSVQFSVFANNTKYKCSELDCRYPDQVRIDISSTFRSGSSPLFDNGFFFFILSAASLFRYYL